MLHTVENNKPQHFKNVKVWATPPYGNTPADAIIRNLTYGQDLGVQETLFKFYASDVKVLS